jgi:hypothetical protein
VTSGYSERFSDSWKAIAWGITKSFSAQVTRFSVILGLPSLIQYLMNGSRDFVNAETGERMSPN